MKKTQIILLVVGIISVAGLYSLPRVVIDNDENSEVSFIDETNPGGEILDHSSEIPEEVQPKIDFWKNRLTSNASSLDEAALDSLMSVYQSINLYDSAAYYAEIYAAKGKNINLWQKAGDAYFGAFTYAIDQVKTGYLGSKAREMYDKVLEIEPARLDIKNNIAMTFIATSNPMQGIMMLREILEVDKENEQALLNMGRLSMQSNQYDRAIERFESLIEYHPKNLDGNYLLAVCYFESGKSAKAKDQFEKVKSMDTDPMVQTAVEEYLTRIK
jgi:tetratricopeptide (TPR) repeat protein